jgi:glycosyltransferase involved in cell wall biosynthesis
MDSFTGREIAWNMRLTAEDITIAVTVFNRRRYIKQAIASALNQSVQVRVLSVEDCGPDPGMEEFVRQEFGSRIEYFRNPRRRGLFGNWNACLDHCQTPWLSILHDDDYLAPGFVEAMVELSSQLPNCGLYFGTTEYVSEGGQPLNLRVYPPLTAPWRRVELAETLRTTPFPFPGHLFRVDYARELGGFRESSQFCGDWEMWSNLIAHYGAAQTRATVAYNRAHSSPERGCTRIDLNGRLRPLVFVQQKRVLRLLRESGVSARFDRAQFLTEAPMSVDYLLRHGAHLPPRILRYNVGLLLRSTPPSTRYAIFHAVTRVLGVRFVRAASRLGHWFWRQSVRPREQKAAS